MEKYSLYKNRTPECVHPKPVHDNNKGEIVCSDCGLVLCEQMIDKRPEWRSSNQERKTRIHTISQGRVSLILKINFRRSSSKDRNFSQGMIELKRLSDKIHIPQSVREEAARLYRKALAKRLVRGRSIAAIVAAALYIACRESETPRTLSDIAGSSSVNKKYVERCYRLLISELNLKVPLADPIIYISKIAEVVKISGRTQGSAAKIIREARKNHVAGGKTPIGIAAAALYIAGLQSNERKTQKDIAKAAGVTEVTIRNRYRALKMQLNLGSPSSFCHKPQ